MVTENQIFLENWRNAQDVIASFEAPINALDGAQVLLAWYGYGSYDGDAFVLFERGGKLYEVNGSHCSCYGLEGQWEPEETSIEALAKREWTNYSDGKEKAGEHMQRILAALAL